LGQWGVEKWALEIRCSAFCWLLCLRWSRNNYHTPC
jgi:hypothetical protein